MIPNTVSIAQKRYLSANKEETVNILKFTTSEDLECAESATGLSTKKF